MIMIIIEDIVQTIEYFKKTCAIYVKANNANTCDKDYSQIM